MRKPLLLAVASISILLTSALPAQAATSITTQHHLNGDITPATVIKPNFSSSNRNALKAGELPASVDLTPWAVTPGDQEQIGSCVSWAIGHSILGWYSNKAGDQQTFAPMYLYSQTHLNNTADGGGSSSWDAFNVTENQGIDTDADYTQGDYNFTTLPTTDEIANAAQYKTSTFHKLFSTGAAQTGYGTQAQTVIEEALATGNPVGLGIPIYAGFDNLNQNNYNLDLNDPNATTGYRGTHYVAVLGYDAQGITIENSWGTSWGNNGFAHLDWNWVDAKASHAEYIDGILKYMPANSLTAPTAPTNVTIYSVSDKTISTTWDESTTQGTTTIKKYSLHITGNGYDKTYTQLGGAYGYVQDINGLKPSTKYTLTFSASNSVGTSPLITKIVQTKQTPAKSPTLHGVHGTIYQTANKWWWKAATPGSGHITKYTIVVTYNGKAIQHHTYSAKTRTATIKHLKRHHTYHFLISAYNSAGKHTTQNWSGKTS